MAAAFKPKWTRQSREADSFYRTNAWKELSELKRTIEPLCEFCEKKGILKWATLAHHSRPIKQFWNDRLKLEYLVSLCDDCHEEVHGTN
jgi:5-methylcytosine-specific restriction protein A